MFNEPSADLRARFTSSGEVYRVIDSSVDRARFAIWRMDVPGPGPGSDSSNPDRGFSTEDLVVRWLRGLGTRLLPGVVQVSVSSLNQDVRWLLFHNSDGSQPRDELVEGSRIRGNVRLADSAPEETTTTAMTTSTACFNLDATDTATITAEG